MKKFFTKKLRKDNKGFSLVELIIVVAIMVALIAVLAPQYIKYVQSSRDAIVKSAADEVLTTAKAEYALGNLTGTGDITISIDANKHLAVALGDGLAWSDASAATGTTFVSICGIDANKTVASTKSYKITIAGTADAPTFQMTEATAANNNNNNNQQQQAGEQNP